MKDPYLPCFFSGERTEKTCEFFNKLICCNNVIFRDRIKKITLWHFFDTFRTFYYTNRGLYFALTSLQQDRDYFPPLLKKALAFILSISVLLQKSSIELFCLIFVVHKSVAQEQNRAVWPEQQSGRADPSPLLGYVQAARGTNCPGQRRRHIDTFLCPAQR